MLTAKFYMPHNQFTNQISLLCNAKDHRKLHSMQQNEFVARKFSLFDPLILFFFHFSQNPVLSNERMKNVLGITDPIPLEQSLLDMSYSMIEAGIIKRTSGYKGPPSEK